MQGGSELAPRHRPCCGYHCRNHFGIALVLRIRRCELTQLTGLVLIFAALGLAAITPRLERLEEAAQQRRPAFCDRYMDWHLFRAKSLDAAFGVIGATWDEIDLKVKVWTIWQKPHARLQAPRRPPVAWARDISRDTAISARIGLSLTPPTIGMLPLLASNSGLITSPPTASSRSGFCATSSAANPAS